MKVERIINKEELKVMRRWLEYVPEHWNMDGIMKKPVGELTPLELSRMIQRQKEDEMAKDLSLVWRKVKNHKKNPLIVLSQEENSRLDRVINAFDFERIAKSKISEREMDTIHDIMDSYKKKGKEEIEKRISSLDNIFLVEYVRHLFAYKNQKTKKLVKA